MARFLRLAIVASSLLLLAARLNAFTLLGPLAPWQTTVLSYDRGTSLGGFGPMNLGEEYRWNVPELTYGFTSDFLNYFGEYGASQIVKAMDMLNALPSASSIDDKTLNAFPQSTLRLNHRAAAIGLTDIKSYALEYVLYTMGLADPTRYGYCLRQRWVETGCPTTGNIDYWVIQRNFDPVTLSYSPYINSDLWSFDDILEGAPPCGGPALLLPVPVDPLGLFGLRHTPVTSLQANSFFVKGGFYTGLTRDDVGGLRYIYATKNYNVETVPAGAIGGTNFSSFGFITGNGSPWSVPVFTTNIVGLTNTAGVTNNFIDPGLRGGVDKVTFTRADYDSLFGGFVTRTNAYTENIIVAGRAVPQVVVRILQAPDILFDTADIQGPDSPPFPPAFTITTHGETENAWVNNDAINGRAGNYGPGTITPSVGATAGFVLTFNNVGPLTGQTWPFFVSQADAVFTPNANLLWGSYDGTTNEPVVYPYGTSIQQIEAQVFGGQ